MDGSCAEDDWVRRSMEMVIEGKRGMGKGS